SARWPAAWRRTTPCGSRSRDRTPSEGDSRLARKRVRGLDDADVRERLREVSDEASTLGVVLLRDEADVVAEREQPIVKRDGLVAATLLVEDGCKPDGAGQEAALAGCQTVDARVLLVGAVALDEAAADEVLLDGTHRAD